MDTNLRVLRSNRQHSRPVEPELLNKSPRRKVFVYSAYNRTHRLTIQSKCPSGQVRLKQKISQIGFIILERQNKAVIPLLLLLPLQNILKMYV